MSTTICNKSLFSCCFFRVLFSFPHRIDRESVCRLQQVCELQVQTAIRCGAFFMIGIITLEIIDINDNPPQFNPSSVTIQILEREAVGSEFGLPTAMDPDMGQGNSIVRYALTRAPPAFFLIQNRLPSFQLKLRLDQTLDREAIPSYTLELEAEDGGNPRKTGTLTINIEVLDINDNPPIFDNLEYTANISEITAVNSAVVTVKARDYDSGPNGRIAYAMPASEQEKQEVFSLFVLNETSGEVKTRIPLDPYAGNVYR